MADPTKKKNHGWNRSDDTILSPASKESSPKNSMSKNEGALYPADDALFSQPGSESTATATMPTPEEPVVQDAVLAEEASLPAQNDLLDAGEVVASQTSENSVLDWQQKEKETKPNKIKNSKARKSAVARLAHSYQNKVGVQHKGEDMQHWLYTECYFIGIQLMRDGISTKRKLLDMWRLICRYIPAFVQKQRAFWLRRWDDFSDAALAPFKEISKKTTLLRISMSKLKRGGAKPSPKIRARLFLSYLRSLSRPLNHIANIVAPIIGITILAATITYFSDITFGLRVTYPNENSFMGYIAEENDFYEAQSKVLERLIGEEYIEPENSTPRFSLVIIKEDNLMDTETLANKLISVSGNEIETADGIYIEDKFLGAVQDGSEFLLYIDSILNNYRTETEHELVQFVKKITVRNGVYPVGSIKPLSDIKEYLDSDVPYEEVHTVAENETVDQIAENYNTTVEQLRLLNPVLQDRMEAEDGVRGAYVVPGDNLLVSRSNLTLGIQVTRREEYDEDVPFGETKVENDQYYVGYTATISNGIPGEQRVVADVTYVDGQKVGENRISVEVTKDPVNKRVVVGTKQLLQYLPSGSDTSGSFMWPVDGGYMSAGLYGYYGHTGMDIAAKQGTVVRASRPGYVTYASNVSIWPYGKRVDINHQDGFTSRYAHMSSVVVKSGIYVNQGDIIGYVGRTGNATGNHLHLEIRLNGVIMNPAKYIGTYYPGR
ncbi:MAG: M23 family metallopeptidase [Angelakisella sp.]|nr:M23 family metallopeptidase [Angelakisella sp.]